MSCIPFRVFIYLPYINSPLAISKVFTLPIISPNFMQYPPFGKGYKKLRSEKKIYNFNNSEHRCAELKLNPNILLNQKKI